MDDDLCTCGDVRDEHEGGEKACTVMNCPCIHFEAADDDPEAD